MLRTTLLAAALALGVAAPAVAATTAPKVTKVSLETVTDSRGATSSGEGWTDLVITPERPLRAVTAMITGLHEPRATHLAMVKQAIAAAGGSDPASQLESAYRAALEEGYLWHEFGDSHLIIGE